MLNHNNEKIVSLESGPNNLLGFFWKRGEVGGGREEPKRGGGLAWASQWRLATKD